MTASWTGLIEPDMSRHIATSRSLVAGLLCFLLRVALEADVAGGTGSSSRRERVVARCDRTGARCSVACLQLGDVVPRHAHRVRKVEVRPAVRLSSGPDACADAGLLVLDLGGETLAFLGHLQELLQWDLHGRGC